MAGRIYLVEPKQLTISRIAEESFSLEAKNKRPHIKIGSDTNRSGQLIRSAGDGMEFDDNESLSSSRHTARSWPESRRPIPLATSTPTAKKVERVKQGVSSRNAKEILGKIKKSEPVEGKNTNKSNSADPSKEVEDLRSKLTAMEEAKEKLIEEKMKVSTQLGIQLQVNTELKTLLVASVGEDLEERLEAMSLKNALTERQAKNLQNQLEERQEELEGAVIQSDVWRSKFLASKVMADELASWKAITDSKYRESNAALETLLEEHKQLTTTIASANRFLLKLSMLTNCHYDDDDLLGRSSIDLAVINHSLAKRITENTIHYGINIIDQTKDTQKSHVQNDSHDSFSTKRKSSLSLGEKRALKAIEEANKEHCHIDKRKQDFLAHSRISHILATRYPMTCLVCKGCKGGLKVV